MRLPNMSSNFLLAPIPENADFFSIRDIKLAVFGASGVGKTAMIVRFLTKRFIGDYETNTGNLYSRLMCLEGEQTYLQIQDTPGHVKMEIDSAPVPEILRCLQWAEGILLVYSITDSKSYEYVRHLYQHIRKVYSDSKIPVILVANKGDLLHVRQVSSDSGIQLANELGCFFVEISTSENCQGVCDVFQYLCKEINKVQTSSSGERRRVSIIPRPRSPNMQDLKRRFKQALTPKVKASSTVA
ncbi:ras family member 11A [Pelobates cultripes]|uniref:small monomeric GTPase n=1 Tax=Pelobates cultripes TaxID=61616 RepID=A0AAD1VR82_PELCU|nr:ras family member 11A [Pelobates cultripes]